MPIEFPPGSTSDYITDLSPDDPPGTDFPSEGDDHLRLIKRALQNSFPNISSQVTLSSFEINRGSVPVGSRVLFYQSAAPDGWFRSYIGSFTYMLRIIPTEGAESGTGGTTAGEDDPVLNDKVPSHTHGISGDGAHDHLGSRASSAASGSSTFSPVTQTGAGNYTAILDSGGHTHTIATNAGAEPWRPRYMNCIICSRQ